MLIRANWELSKHAGEREGGTTRIYLPLLDSQTGAEEKRLLQELNQQAHTVIIVNHNMDATDACQRVIALRDGRIV